MSSIRNKKRNRRILDWVGDAFGALGIFASIYFFMLLAYGLGY